MLEWRLVSAIRNEASSHAALIDVGRTFCGLPIRGGTIALGDGLLVDDVVCEICRELLRAALQKYLRRR